MTNQQVVKTKMSSSSLVVLLVPRSSFVPLGSNTMPGLDRVGSEVRAWAEGLGSVVGERYGNWTFSPKVILSWPQE